MGHERDFSEAARAFICLNEFLQNLLATRGASINDMAFLKPDLDTSIMVP